MTEAGRALRRSWGIMAVFEHLAALSFDFAPDLGIVRPFVAANFGGVYGQACRTELESEAE